MKNTIKKIEELLVNLHDLYSKNEVQTILSNLLEEARNDEHSDFDLDEHRQAVISSISERDFEESCEFSLDGKELSIDIDVRGIVDVVFEAINNNLEGGQ